MSGDEKRLRVGFYDWCLQEVRRELEDNCSTLSALKSSLAAIYVEYMSADVGKTVATAVALVKRFHLTALKLKMEEFTPEDQRLVDNFSNFFRFKRFGAAAKVRPISKLEQKLQEPELAEILRDSLKPILGIADLADRGVWRYETDRRGLRVVTFVDIAGRLPLRYTHRVMTQTGSPLFETSVLHWHGISTETAWDLMGPQDVGQSVKVLAEVCNHFLAGITSFC